MVSWKTVFAIALVVLGQARTSNRLAAQRGRPLTSLVTPAPNARFSAFPAFPKSNATMNCLSARATADDGGPANGCIAAMLQPCIFCDVSVERGFDIILEDDDIVVFRDINPASVHHLQVVPKRHIDNVKSLRAKDADLVRRMRAAGMKALDLLDAGADRRLGFHIPPYISVGHLHMHAHALPFKNRLRAAKYPVRPGGKGKHKGFSWFAEAEQTIAILESGGTVKIRPC